MEFFLSIQLYAISWWSFASASRFDVLNPIVTRGEDGSEFGYSVSFHSFKNEKRYRYQYS